MLLAVYFTVVVAVRPATRRGAITLDAADKAVVFIAAGIASDR
jgi:hypothetical protein